VCGGNFKVIDIGEIYEAAAGEDWPHPRARVV
jgi:hypothetical protein